MSAPTAFGLGLRLVFFFFLEIVGLKIFATFIYELFGYIAAGALGTFFAAAVANAVVVRIWERGRFDDVGMGWTRHSRQHLLCGLAAGSGAAVLAVLIPVAFGLASFTADREAGFGPGRLGFLIFLLTFGAVGEELLFRGYGFQVLLGRWGGRVAIPVFAAFFAYMHVGNLAASGVASGSAVEYLAMGNTFLWGALLGYAVLRSGALWLPIGLHFGWNMLLPLLGVRLSGYTMGVTGYILRWNAGNLWSGGAYGPEASVLTTLVVVATAWTVHRMRLDPQTLVLVEQNRERAS